MWGLIPRSWDHDLSRREKLNGLSPPGLPGMKGILPIKPRPVPGLSKSCQGQGGTWRPGARGVWREMRAREEKGLPHGCPAQVDRQTEQSPSGVLAGSASPFLDWEPFEKWVKAADCPRRVLLWHVQPLEPPPPAEKPGPPERVPALCLVLFTAEKRANTSLAQRSRCPRPAVLPQARCFSSRGRLLPGSGRGRGPTQLGSHQHGAAGPETPVPAHRRLRGPGHDQHPGPGQVRSRGRPAPGPSPRSLRPRRVGRTTAGPERDALVRQTLW